MWFQLATPAVPAILLITSVASATAQWQEVWSDEFNYAGAPDPSKWGYEIGKIRNGEAQYYTNRPENVRVENGNLVIEARKESYEGAAYTSASLQTLSDDHKQVKFTTTGGRLEVRAKLPSAGGAWPAFWTMSTDVWDDDVGWPKGGEIDVFEYIANTPYVVFGNVHYQGSDGQHRDSVAVYDPRSSDIHAAPISADFHTFRVDWYADRIEWYCDNVKYHQFAINPATMSINPFDDPHYLLLNLAVGGSWGSPIDPNFQSAQYLVDYIRVSHLVNTPEPASISSFGLALMGLLWRRRVRKD